MITQQKIKKRFYNKPDIVLIPTRESLKAFWKGQTKVNQFKKLRIKDWIRKKGYEPTIKKTIALFRRHGVREYVQRISDTKWHYICKTKRKEIIYNVTHEFIMKEK